MNARPALLLLLLLLPTLGAGLASAQEGTGQATYARGCERLVDALALVAARDGAESARQLTGPRLPGYLDRALGALQDAPAAGDLRGFEQLRLQATLVPRLLAPPPVADARARFTRDASGRLAGALDMLESDCARLRTAAQQAAERGTREQVASRLAARALDAGPELLVMAQGAPLWRARLAAAETPAAIYALLADLLDHAADPVVDFALRVLWEAPKQIENELGALDRGRAVEAARQDLAQRLRAAARALTQAVDASAQAVTAIRDVELAKVVAGRGPELQQALRLYAAYKGQFDVPPDLEATPWVDVYAQRGSGQLFFWAEQEGRWTAGGEPVAPLEPVLQALVAAQSPELRAQLGNARALGAFYTLFHEPSEVVAFGAGLRGFLEPVVATAAAWQRAAQLLHPGGRLERSPQGLALELGYSPFVGPRGPAEATEALLTACLEGGRARARGLARAVDRAARRWRDRRLEAVRVEPAAPPGVSVDLCWRPAPDDPRWLIAPPEQVLSGDAAWGVLSLPVDAPVPALSVVAGARHDDGYLGGAAAPTVGETTPLPLEPAAGPRLALSADGRRVEQLPREARLLHMWLETPRGSRLLRPHARGAWLDPDPRDPAASGRVAARGGSQRVAPTAVDLPDAPGVVLGDPTADPVWALSPGEPLTAQVITRGEPQPGPFSFVVRDAHGGVVHAAEGASLRWPADAPPGRYQVTVDGCPPTWFAIGDAAPQIVASASPLSAGVPSLAPGQGGVLRLEAWPWLSADEVTHVTWRWLDEPTSETTTYPLPGQPETALHLPLRLSSDAAPGERRVEAEVHTPHRGALRVTGSLRVAPGRAIDLTLRDETGDPLQRLVRGGLGQVRPSEPLRAATWTLVDPAGRCRDLAAEPSGEVAVSVPPDGLWGGFEVWLRGEARADGEPVHARLPLTVTRGRPGAESGLPFAWVRARAQGAEARQGGLRPVQVTARGSALGVVSAPGPLGWLALRVETVPVVGDGPARLRLYVVGEPRDPPPGVTLPGVWNDLGRRAQLCLEASLQLERDGQPIQVGTLRRVEAGGVDLTLELTVDPEALVARPLHSDAPPLRANLGSLARARRLDLVVRVRLRAALPPSTWPPQRDPPPPLAIDGVEWAIDPSTLPPTTIELRARWSRADEPLEEAVGDLHAGSPRASSGADALAAANAALRDDRPGAAAIHARRATLLTGGPDAWTALAEVALLRRHPDEAQALAREALRAGDHGRAWLVVAEAALAADDAATARDAAAAAEAQLPADSPLKSRLQRLLRKLR